MMAARTLLVIQHVPHERLGTLEAPLKRSGCELSFLHTYDSKAAWPDLTRIQGIVVMGGPMSVSQQGTYPFLTRELALLREAMAAERPILGICLGAQLLAAALGAPVTKAEQHEIGWFPIVREPGADDDPLLEIFEPTETVLQWHSDTFALPQGAVRLASSPRCREQGFRYRDRVYGLQFHPEMTEAMVRAWMRTPDNKAMFERLRLPAAPGAAQAGGDIDPTAIRRDCARHVPRLQELAHHVATTFARLVSS